jgi:hypothetical protein
MKKLEEVACTIWGIKQSRASQEIEADTNKKENG